MAWKADASRLLELLTHEELGALHKYYWHRDELPASRAELVEEILAKESKPASLLTRQQITADLMRRYLGVSKGAKADMKIQICKNWVGDESTSTEVEMEIPVLEESQSSNLSAGKTNSKKRASTSDLGPPAKSNPPLDMHRWWIVRTDDGCHYSGLVDGQLKDTELVTDDRDQNLNGPHDWGTVVDRTGQRFRLKEPQTRDGEIVVKRSDMFGPWPEPMVGGDAVHLQLARNLSALSADMRVRLTQGLNKEKVMPMAMNNYLYRLLQIINGLACRDTLISEAKKLNHPLTLPAKAKVIAPEAFATWADSTGLDVTVISELEALNTLFEQIKDKATRVHELLYFKDKHQILRANVERAGPASVAAAVNRRKFRVLESAEQRAVQSREETQRAKAREKDANEAQRKEMKIEEARGKIDSLRAELEGLRRDEHRLQQVRGRLEEEHNQLQMEIMNARDRMAQAITTTGSAFPRELFAELELLERTLAAVETDMSALLEQLGAVNDSTRESQRKLTAAERELQNLA